MSNFKVIPNFSKYEISEIGLIRNVKTKSAIKTEGRSARLYNDDGRQIIVSITEIKNKVFNGQDTELKSDAAPLKPLKVSKSKPEKKIDDKKQKNKDKIKALLAEGKTRPEIRKILGVKSINYAVK